MPQKNHVEAILFDRAQVERLDDLPDRPERLNGAKLLWVDIDRSDDESAATVAETFELDDATRERLASSAGRATFHDYGRYIHVRTFSPSEEEEDADEDLIALECVVGKNWVITAHDRPIPVLEEFTDRVSGSGDTGALDGPAFLATLLEWVLNATRRRSSGWRSGSRNSMSKRCEGRVSSGTTRCDTTRGRCPSAGALRTPLRAHRAHPSRTGGARQRRVRRAFSISAETLRSHRARSARRSRKHRRLLRRADRQNRTSHERHHENPDAHVRHPAAGRAVIAGVMGMNFKLDFFEATWLFYVVLAVILAIAAVTAGVAKLRGWI
jgi:magnesium transporter